MTWKLKSNNLNWNNKLKSTLQRDKQVQRIIVIEGCINLAVLIAKLIVGLGTGSLAIVADALHSLTDVVNNLIAFFVVRLSCMPPDKEHPYGHRKFETLAVFILASLLVLLSFELALHALSKEESEVTSTNWGLTIMIAVLAINIGVSLWQRMWAKRLQSDILNADASHTFTDALTTIVVITGWQLSTMGYLWLDRLCALGVAAFVLYLAYNLFKKSLPILTDEFAIDPELINTCIKRVKGVKEVKRIRSRWIGSEKLLDLIITVDADISTEASHTIASQIETLIESRFSINDVSIHVEPHINE